MDSRLNSRVHAKNNYKSDLQLIYRLRLPNVAVNNPLKLSLIELEQLGRLSTRGKGISITNSTVTVPKILMSIMPNVLARILMAYQDR